MAVFLFFSDGGTVFLAFFGDDCEKVLIKELEHVNAIVSNKPNKHGGELVDIETLYPNFVRELRTRIRIDGTEELYWGGFEYSTVNVCPPTVVVDGLKLIKIISGTKKEYIESLYGGEVIIYHTSVGSYAIYNDENPEPKYLKWDNILNAWISVEVDDGVFFKQFRAGAENFLSGFAYVAILGSNLASGGVGLGAASILGVELTTAGAMYVMDGDQNSLIMDLVLAPIGAAASIAQDAAKLGNALVDASKAADLKSATHLGLMATKGIAATNDIKIVDKAGNLLDWNEIKRSVNEIVGPDISKFANDFATIAKKSGKHLDLLACSDSSGARDNGSGTRSGGCKYPLVRAWTKLIEFASTRKKIQWLEGFGQFIDEGYDIAKSGSSLIVKSGNDVVVEVVNDIPKLTKHKIVPKPDSEVILKASDVNPSYPAGWDPPYHSGYPAIDFKNVSNEQFVRVFKQGSNSSEGAFVMKQSDIIGLTPTQIKDKFALDFVPDKIVDVNVPANTNMRTGKVAPRPNGTSGGEIQFELREQISSSNFTNIRDL